jgi:hypothetical protein
VHETAAGVLPFDPRDLAAPADADRVQRNALIAGGAGLALSLLGYLLAPPVFFRAYLVAWVLATGTALGCLAIAMLHHLSRGGWGLVVRRVLEAASRTLPVLLLLALPLVLLPARRAGHPGYESGLLSLYEWARPEVVAGDPVLQHKEPYLNVPFFIVRLILYFAIWYGLAWVLNRMSLEQDRTGDPRLVRRMQLIAAPGLAAYCLAATFAAVDWLMSLQPHWFSTIYGVYFVGGHGLSALAFLILVAGYLSRREPMSRVLARRHFHDYGKLFLAFLMLWAYFSFSQFLIIWAGNLPEETVWYARRIRGGWQWVALSLVVLHFAIPFLLLLSRDLKRAPRLLARVAALLLLMRWVDLFWQVEPAFDEGRFTFHWLFPAALLGVGGLWLAAFFRELKRRPLLPVNDPYLADAVAPEASAHA